MSAAPRPTPAQAKAQGFTKAVPPEPKRYPQCRNCASLVYDSADYMDMRGKECWRRENLRCSIHKFAVQMGTVCSSHTYYRPDRSDR